KPTLFTYTTLFRSEDTLVRSERANIKVTGYTDNFKLFEFNNLTSEVKIDEKKIHPITIVHMFRDINLAKVKTGMGSFWTDMSDLEYDRDSLPEYEAPYTIDETVVFDLIKNKSEERKMNKSLVERLKSQIRDTDVEVEPSNTEEVENMIIDENLETMKLQLEREKERREKVEKRYKNLKIS